MWGVINSKGVCTPVSNTEKGAKNYATRNDYKSVGRISKYSMTVYDIKVKAGKKWVSDCEVNQ